MTTDEHVADLYRQFSALSPKSQSDFLTLLKGTGTKVDIPKPSSTFAADLLYAKIAEKVYSYQGIRLPFLAALKKTAAGAELEAAIEWLTKKEKVDRETMGGLIEIASDAIGREVAWCRTRTGGMRTDVILSLLRSIPVAVDRAYPGYAHNNILTKIAKEIGSGNLPLIKTDED